MSQHFYHATRPHPGADNDVITAVWGLITYGYGCLNKHRLLPRPLFQDKRVSRLLRFIQAAARPNKPVEPLDFLGILVRAMEEYTWFITLGQEVTPILLTYANPGRGSKLPFFIFRDLQWFPSVVLHSFEVLRHYEDLRDSFHKMLLQGHAEHS